MPEEGRRFTQVDKNWRDIMKAADIVCSWCIIIVYKLCTYSKPIVKNST